LGCRSVLGASGLHVLEPACCCFSPLRRSGRLVLECASDKYKRTKLMTTTKRAARALGRIELLSKSTVLVELQPRWKRHSAQHYMNQRHKTLFSTSITAGVSNEFNHAQRLKLSLLSIVVDELLHAVSDNASGMLLDVDDLRSVLAQAVATQLRKAPAL
jgi:hypothetical protein